MAQLPKEIIIKKKNTQRKESFSFEKTRRVLELPGFFAELLTLRLHGNGAVVCLRKSVTVKEQLNDVQP